MQEFGISALLPRDWDAPNRRACGAAPSADGAAEQTQSRRAADGKAAVNGSVVAVMPTMVAMMAAMMTAVMPPMMVLAHFATGPPGPALTLHALVGVVRAARRIILRACRRWDGGDAENKAGSDNQRLHWDSSPHWTVDKRRNTRKGSTAP